MKEEELDGVDVGGRHASDEGEYVGVPAKREASAPHEESGKVRRLSRGSADDDPHLSLLKTNGDAHLRDHTTHADRVERPESAPSGIEVPSPSAAHHNAGAGNRAYLAHAAPHLFPAGPSNDDGHGAGATGRSSAPLTPSSSRSPSPSLGSARASSSYVTASSKHRVPPHFRGPMPRDTDAEDIAPLPALQSVHGSETMYQPHNTPLNRNGWRYTFAGPCTSHLPNSVFKSIPAQPPSVRWDWSDRSGFTKIAADADVVTSDKGWRSARANVPVRQGSWYCEIEILPPEQPSSTASQEAGSMASPASHSQSPMHAAPAPQLPPASSTKDGPHVRLGWARREAPLNAPVGFDAYSYGLRDTSGQRVFLSRPLPYGEPFRAGDVVGMYIHLPPLSQPIPTDRRDPRHVRRRRIPIKYRGQLYFEQLEYAQTKEMEHLMERSWAGEQLTRRNGSLALLSGSAGLDVDSHGGSGVAESGLVTAHSGVAGKRSQKPHQAPSQPTAPPGTGKSKRQAGPGTVNGQDAKAKPRKELRPVPTLGETSRIGFFLNGQPQGWAFRDLLDFRPLRSGDDDAKKRKQDSAASVKALAGGASPSGAAPADEMSAAGLGLDDTPLLTTSASLAAIMKSRENHFDDGSTGYFPIVSLYGAARARIRTKAEEMRFPPEWQRIEAMLEEADRAHGRSSQPAVEEPGSSTPHASGPHWWGHTRPLAERHSEYWSEQWQYDLEEEERARIRAKFWKPPVDDEEDDVNSPSGGTGTDVGGEGADSKHLAGPRSTGGVGSSGKKRGGGGGGGAGPGSGQASRRGKGGTGNRASRERSSTTPRGSGDRSEDGTPTPAADVTLAPSTLQIHAGDAMHTDEMDAHHSDGVYDEETKHDVGNARATRGEALSLLELADVAALRMMDEHPQQQEGETERQSQGDNVAPPIFEAGAEPIDGEGDEDRDDAGQGAATDMEVDD
ncbi:unnamed protein product [Parajaminaea phylloscopi]